MASVLFIYKIESYK